MRLTKYGHACVRLEKDGGTVVIDPGSFSGEGILEGADAVLITHEHFDHLDQAALRAAAGTNPDLEIWTCEAVAGQIGEVPAKIQTVRQGDAFETAGFGVKVIGEWHAPTHPDLPIIQNVGYLVDEEVFYPGDALTPPGVDVPTLLVPTNAPWLKLSEMIEYLRAVRPARAFSTHDGLVNEIGQTLIDNWLKTESDKQKADFRRLSPGESTTLPG
jgi:L-ascorbate metabolism protein UlaG (beta-lactamase superfamily)